MPICDACKEPMTFLLQMYAPVSENIEAFHRIIYIFVCTKPKCQRSGKEIKALRAQLPRKNDIFSYEPPGKQQMEDAMKRREEAKITDPNEKLIEIISEKKKISNKIISFVDDDEEDEELLKLYVKNAQECKEVEDEDNGEELKDLNIPETDFDKRFLLFNYVVQNNPESIVRYSRNEKCAPLWMGKKHVLAPKYCLLCGGVLCAEIQLMPKMFARSDLIELDFESIIIFTCAKSCSIKGYAEEKAVVEYCDESESINKLTKSKKH